MRDPEKPQQIIDAAIRVFARTGYYNSRVSDIAREAGIASGTIYLYFKTKEEILVTLFREKMAGFVAPAAARDRRRARSGGQDPPAGRCALRGAGAEPRAGRGGAGGAAAGQQVLPRRLGATRSSAYFELIGSVLEEGVGRRPLPRRPAREGGDQGALRRHGPDGHLVGAGQARLPPASPRRRPQAGARSSSKESRAMAFETLSSSAKSAFVVITLNRPPANAISETLDPRAQRRAAARCRPTTAYAR